MRFRFSGLEGKGRFRGLDKIFGGTTERGVSWREQGKTGFGNQGSETRVRKPGFEKQDSKTRVPRFARNDKFHGRNFTDGLGARFTEYYGVGRVLYRITGGIGGGISGIQLVWEKSSSSTRNIAWSGWNETGCWCAEFIAVMCSLSLILSLRFR